MDAIIIIIGIGIGIILPWPGGGRHPLQQGDPHVALVDLLPHHAQGFRFSFSLLVYLSYCSTWCHRRPWWSSPQRLARTARWTRWRSHVLYRIHMHFWPLDIIQICLNWSKSDLKLASSLGGRPKKSSRAEAGEFLYICFYNQTLTHTSYLSFFHTGKVFGK